MGKQEWPEGLSKAVAKLSLEPSQLTAQFGIEFFDDRDDLDAFRAALLLLGEGREYALIRYWRSPEPGTEIWIREDCPDAEESVQVLLDVLALPLIRFRGSTHDSIPISIST